MSWKKAFLIKKARISSLKSNEMINVGKKKFNNNRFFLFLFFFKNTRRFRKSFFKVDMPVKQTLGQKKIFKFMSMCQSQKLLRLLWDSKKLLTKSTFLRYDTCGYNAFHPKVRQINICQNSLGTVPWLIRTTQV